jgi:hypothetical protein
MYNDRAGHVHARGERGADVQGDEYSFIGRVKFDAGDWRLDTGCAFAIDAGVER